MSGNLLLQYNASDTGARPLPANTTFWLSPAVVLGTIDGNYTVTNPPSQTTIDVQVSLIKPAAYEIINVEVWVCDPTTVAGPSTALAPFQGATAQQLTLTGYYEPADPTTPISAVPVIQVNGFLPYPGISSLPGGHCCLIANCWGTSGDGTTTDGVDLNTVAAANLPNEVQTDQHVAQHNIFADVSHGDAQNKVITFPFRAGSTLLRGVEPVTLEFTQLPPAQLQGMLRGGVQVLKGPKFANLHLQVSDRPVKMNLTGAKREGCNVELELEAHKSQVLNATMEFDPADPPGALHGFDVVQKGPGGKEQGGFRLLTVRGH